MYVPAMAMYSQKRWLWVAGFVLGCSGDLAGTDTDSSKTTTEDSSDTSGPGPSPGTTDDEVTTLPTTTSATDGTTTDPTTDGTTTTSGPTTSEETTDDTTDTTTGPVTSECNDGIDNDGDGYVDWQGDFGCYGPGDNTEAALPRDQEDGFTTFELPPDSVVIYVSNEGDDKNDGRTPETAVATIQHAASLVRDGEHDFILLRRGDVWRDVSLNRFKSGKDAEHPLVIGSYGDSLELPRIELGNYFIDHNGQARSNVALIGLDFISFRGNPNDPGFNGQPRPALRYVGGGSGHLIEGCHFKYAEITVQSYSPHHYDGVQVRRNVIERAYHRDTCLPGNPNGNNMYRPSGIFVSHADNVLIEGNVFDHNGWNPKEEPTACATIFNHNMYVNGHDMVIRDNIIARASSIGIKYRSDTPGDMTKFRAENNFFVEGEIGISLGGNSEQVHRFADGVIHNNVFTDIGRSQPTGRTLAWSLDLLDNDGLKITDNLILNNRQPGVGNAYGLSISGGSGRKHEITNNLFWRLQSRSITINAKNAHSDILFANNTVADTQFGSRLVHFSGPFSGYKFEGNKYRSSANENQWFNVSGQGQNLNGWTAASGEKNASTFDVAAFPDPDRDAESYAQHIGEGSTLEDLLSAARKQSRLNWRTELTAPAINDWIRAGFGR
jgi:hypothetical protein